MPVEKSEDGRGLLERLEEQLATAEKCAEKWKATAPDPQATIERVTKILAKQAETRKKTDLVSVG